MSQHNSLTVCRVLNCWSHLLHVQKNVLGMCIHWCRAYCLREECLLARYPEFALAVWSIGGCLSDDTFLCFFFFFPALKLPVEVRGVVQGWTRFLLSFGGKKRYRNGDENVSLYLLPGDRRQNKSCFLTSHFFPSSV